MKLAFFRHVSGWLAPGGHLIFQAYGPGDEPMGRCIKECSPHFAAGHAVHLCDAERAIEAVYIMSRSHLRDLFWRKNQVFSFKDRC